jgi:hypothetical protein
MNISFFEVATKVEAMYNKSMSLTNEEAINKECEKIQDFLTACGYTQEQYLDKLNNFNLN